MNVSISNLEDPLRTLKHGFWKIVIPTLIIVDYIKITPYKEEGSFDIIPHAFLIILTL